MVFNQWNSSVNTKTMIVRVRLIIVVWCLLAVSYGSAVIDKHCLHGQSFNLLIDGTVVEVSNCSFDICVNIYFCISVYACMNLSAGTLTHSMNSCT